MPDEEHEERDSRDEGATDDGASLEEHRVTEKKPWHQLSREEVMERLEGYQAKQRANRRRLTGDDVQEMLRERRALRQQRKQERREQRDSGQRPRRDVGRTVRLSLGGALLVGAIGTGALAASSTDSGEAQSQRNDHAIALLNGEIRALEADTWDEQDAAALEEQLEQAVEQAQAKGEQVARAQNAYQEIFADLNGVERPGYESGDKDEFYAPLDELRAELVDLFDESARIVQDEDSYYHGSHMIYGPTEIDVLAPWYNRFTEENRDTYSEASLNSWELVSAAPRGGSPHSIDVAWLNRDTASGDLLSWAKATYNVQTGMFHSLYVGVTTFGERPSGGADPESDTDSESETDPESDTDPDAEADTDEDDEGTDPDVDTEEA